MRTVWVSILLVVSLFLAGCTKETPPPPEAPAPTWFLADLGACGPDNATLPPCEGNLQTVEVLPPTLPQRTWTCIASSAQTDSGFAVYHNLVDNKLGVVFRVGPEGAHYPGWVHLKSETFDVAYAIPGTENRGLVIFDETLSLGDTLTVTGLHMSVNYTSNRTELSDATPRIEWLIGPAPTTNDTARVHIFETEAASYYVRSDNVTDTLLEGTDFFLGISYRPFPYLFETTVEPQPSGCGT